MSLSVNVQHADGSLQSSALSFMAQISWGKQGMAIIFSLALSSPSLKDGQINKEKGTMAICSVYMRNVTGVCQ